MAGPLNGVRVLSVEQFGAGPYGTMLMANLGAEVIKIEPSEGDFSRRTGPRAGGELDSSYFQCMNLSKKSISLDLSDEDDRATFHDLVTTADIVVNNLRGSAVAKLGLDYESLSVVNPRVVCGHISAYGRDNSRADRPGYDFLMQAEAGLMYLTGEPGRAPARMGVSMIDYMSGSLLAVGVLAALRGASVSGKGCDIDTALFDTALHQLAYQASWYLNGEGASTPTPRSAHPYNTPVQTYRTQDGWIYVAAMSSKFWGLLTTGVGLPELFSDPRFATAEARFQNRDTLTEVLDDAFSARVTSEWVELLGNLIPLAPVLTLEGALENPFLIENRMVETIPHPTRGSIRVLGNPIKVNGQRPEQTSGPQFNGDFEATVGRVRADSPGAASARLTEGAM